MDRLELIDLVERKHRMRIDGTDPVFVLATIGEALNKEAAEQMKAAADRMEAATARLPTALDRLALRIHWRNMVVGAVVLIIGMGGMFWLGYWARGGLIHETCQAQQGGIACAGWRVPPP
jgi:hypothetical protein